MRTVGRRILIGAALLGVAVLGAACGSPGHDKLLVAGPPSEDPETQSVRVYAVEPGDDLSDDTIIARDAVSPVGVAVSDSGRYRFNRLGVDWSGSVLMGFGGTDGNQLTSGDPGGDQTEVAAGSELQALLLRRGAYTTTDSGCSLAASPGEAADRVGDGACAISDDERWVVSWPTEGELTIRDLRHDSTVTVEDVSTIYAAVIGADARVLAMVSDGEGAKGLLIDAETGETIEETPVYERLTSVRPAAEGFVVAGDQGDGSQLAWVDVDGNHSVIDTGELLIPVAADHQVTYLKLGQDPAGGSLRRWDAGDDGEEPEVLLTGDVGAAPVEGDEVVASKQTRRGIEFYREGSDGMEQILDVSTATGTPIMIDRYLATDDSAALTITSESGTSAVRLDLSGGDSDIPLRDQASLNIEAVDGDGTLLFTARRGDEERERILALRPHDHEPDVRASAEQTGTNLIHDGVVYFTRISGQEPSVHSVRASGEDRDVTDLYSGSQIAGATWPELGDMVTSQFVNWALLAAQSQNAQSQGQAQP